MLKDKTFYYGGLFVALLTILVDQVAKTELATEYRLSPLTLAILLGILIGNSFYPKIAVNIASGIHFAKQTLLRLGIVLYGFRLTLQDIGNVGVNAILTNAVMLISTFFITLWFGIHYLKMDKNTVYLTGAGCSICGAAAVMATGPVIKAESHQISVAVAVVVIFGTLSMLLYPVFYSYVWNIMSPHQFGIYIGSSVHEVAQVYAAGGNISPEVADTAVISKMIRVMLLAPFLLALSWALVKNSNNPQRNKINIPWFAVFFILVAVFNSFSLLPKDLVNLIVEIDGLLLIAAMTALGLTTHIRAIKQAGVKPLILGGLVYLWLTGGGFVLNMATAALL